MHTQPNTSLDELAGAIAAALPDLDPAGQLLAITLYRLLAARRPVATADLAAATGLPEPAVAETLGSWPAVFTDGQGRVTGFWGLAISELSPAHRYESGGQVLYAWCAWDTLFLPGSVGSSWKNWNTTPTCPPRQTASTSPLIVSIRRPSTVCRAHREAGPCDVTHRLARRERDVAAVCRWTRLCWAKRRPTGELLMTAPHARQPQVLPRPACTPTAIRAVLAANAGGDILQRYDEDLDAAYEQAREQGDVTPLVQTVKRWWFEADAWRDPQAQRKFLARVDTYRDEGPPPADQRVSREEIRTQFGV
jgi:hypothetical protein